MPEEQLGDRADFPAGKRGCPPPRPSVGVRSCPLLCSPFSLRAQHERHAACSQSVEDSRPCEKKSCVPSPLAKPIRAGAIAVTPACVPQRRA